MQYGCIGGKLSHSFSLEIHEMLASYSYELKEMMEEEVGKFLTDKNFKGVNVTIPYKETVIPFLDEVDEVARMIGAVNTIVNRSGSLIGYNTDFYGLTALFSHAGISPEGKKVAILGTGGTSKTACAVVRALHAREILVVSRTPAGEQIGYEELKEKHRDIEILINTTPCGMYPMCEDTPLSLDGFDALSGVIDAIYNPLTTALVREAREGGIVAVGGLYMLVAQAVRASELFLSRPYPEGTTDRIFSLISKAKNNIVLIGMPSSGKSTVGRMLSLSLSRPFIDTDKVFYEKFGTSPENYIREHGEDAFREKEALVCREVAKNTGYVIATGGGVILREENMRAFKQNGYIVFLDRALSDLFPSGNRPLTFDRATLEERYYERIDKYREYADIAISGSYDKEKTVRLITDQIAQRFSL